MKTCSKCGQPLPRKAPTGGKPPYGFTLIDGLLMWVDNEQGLLVLWALKHHLQGVTYRALAAHLNEIGQPAPNGGRWSHSIVHRVVRQAKEHADLIPVQYLT